MDLGENWEKKALIGVAVVVLILVVYAFNPFQTKSNLSGINQTNYSPAPSTTISTPAPTVNTTNSSNNTNNTFLITADQAKKIALSANYGYTAGDPIQGTIVVNQTTVVVWIVQLSKFQNSKTVYVDVNSGKIINVLA